MISIVNGFVCSSSCDVEAAKKGKDPNAPPGSPPGTTAKNDKTSNFDKQPVTILDGALKGTANGVTAAKSGTAQRSLVNLLA